MLPLVSHQFLGIQQKRPVRDPPPVERPLDFGDLVQTTSLLRKVLCQILKFPNFLRFLMSNCLLFVQIFSRKKKIHTSISSFTASHTSLQYNKTQAQYSYMSESQITIKSGFLCAERASILSRVSLCSQSVRQI